MKRRDIIRKLTAAGFTQRKSKGRNPHDVYIKPGFPIIPVPRHTEVDEKLAQKILETAGLK